MFALYFLAKKDLLTYLNVTLILATATVSETQDEFSKNTTTVHLNNAIVTL